MSFHQFNMKAIDGSDVSFDTYKGKHCLIVNVASECGFTRQYKGLEQLQQSYGGDSFTVLGFPCNQFGEQEPGSDAEVCEFAESNFGVTFQLFSKVEVNGDSACELYDWLKEERAAPNGKSDIAWNFTKFLVDGEGSVVKRFEPRDTPSDIEEHLKSML